MFTLSQLQNMFKLQAEANNVMSDAWLNSDNLTIPYYRAIHMELSECLDWIGYKWWKKTTPNVDNAIMEMVDVLHFMISEHLRQGHQRNLAGLESLDFMTDRFPMLAEQPANLQELIEYAIFNTLANQHLNYSIFYVLTETICGLKYPELSPEQVGNLIYRMYVGKNLLNKFRTSMGQRSTGSYVKIWNGREDNDYLIEFLATQSQELSLEQLEYNVDEYLTKTYNELVAQGKEGIM